MYFFKQFTSNNAGDNSIYYYI